MSVIIRLQNLPWSANAHDIREFFKGLSIPEGGVHIVGGELGDAFIAFSSDEDARLAMQKSGTSLKGIQITLLLSSRSEMQKVIETARQQALGMQSFMTPVVPVTPVVAPVQSVAPPQLPTPPAVVQSQFQPPNMQGHPQRMTTDEQVHTQSSTGPNAYPGRPLQPNQHGQNFPQSFNAQQSLFGNQMPFPGQQKVAGFPPGVVMPPPFYGQPPPIGPVSSASTMTHHVQNVENTPPPNTGHNFSSAGGHQASSYSMSPSQSQSTHSQEDMEEEKKDKKLVSSSSASRDKRDSRDNKGRDERRRRSKSRSRSRSKDRRRRHRSRSRSRSRDKSGRRRRSRSRDRDRARDSTRDKDRDRRERKDTRSYREKSDRSSQENTSEMQPPQEKGPEISGGIPGLGDIPDDIPKEGLSIFTQPSTNTVQTKETPPSSGWLKAGNVPEQKSFNQPTQIPEKQAPPKPFLLANPPNINPSLYGSPKPNPPLLADPPLVKNPPISGPYNSGDPHFKVDGGPGNYKTPLLQHPKEDSSSREYPPEDRREWSEESYDRRKYREDDRSYRNPNHNRDRNFDSPKPNWEGSSWDTSKESDKGQHVGEWGRPFPPRRDDDYGYGRDKDPNSRNPDQAMQQDRRDHMYATRTFGGSGNYSNDYGNEYDERYSRGGFRGRGRRGGFGRENDRGLDPSRMGEDLPYRERHPLEFERRGGRGLLRGRGGRGPPISDYPRERRPKTCSVEIRNVPTNASYGPIRELFTGLMVPNGSVKILGGQRGERIGIALVQFNSTRDAFEATRRSGGYVFDSRVTVSFIDDAIYLDAKDIGSTKDNVGAKDSGGANDNNSEESVEPMDISSSSCVYVSGLPIGCTDHDVSRLFENFKVENIVLELEKGSRQPSGGCFVRFVAPEEAENALSSTKHPNIDGAPVKIELCSLEAMEVAAKEREKIKNRPPPQPQQQTQERNPSEIGTKEHLMQLTHLKQNENNRNKKTNSDENSNSFNQNGNENLKKGADLLTDSIVIKNALADITETSIRDFLSDEGLIPEKVYFNRPDSEGKSDIFVIFPKITDAKRATKKNLQLLGSTEVTVELISKPTVMLAMGLPFDPRELFQKGNIDKKNDPPQPENNEHEDYQMTQNYPPSHYDNQYRDRGYNPRYNRHYDPHQGGGYRPRHPFNYRREHDRYPQERGNYEDRLPSHNGADINKATAPPQDFGKPGCVVALANLPYQASTEDILNFFKDFENLLPENIIRRYDEKNRPTSDSRVSLSSPEEATRAVKTLNREYIHGRTIYVSLVN